jgi:hypothetical protein
VHSSQDDIEAFKNEWSEIPRVTKDIFAPSTDETIDISVNTRQYEIRLSEEIAKTIKWQTVQNQQIAHIIGNIIPPPPPTANGTNSDTTETSTAVTTTTTLPTLSVLSGKATSIPPARPLHVGEVRLLELKQRLQRAGYNALLGEGVLVCDGVVRVLKDEGGRGVRIEGVIGAEGERTKAYYEVRKAIYEGLAVV